MTKDVDGMSSYVNKLKTSALRLFGTHFRQGLITLKLLVLDHMVDHLDRFGTFIVLRASPCEHFNSIFKQSDDCSSKRLNTRIGDTMRNVDSSLRRQQFSAITLKKAIPPQISSIKSPALPQSNAGLVRHGHKTFLSFHVFLSFDIQKMSDEMVLLLYVMYTV